ncbi:MAG: hypothetical protein RL120_16155 [Gammaproteobacteria bacterium]
MELPDFTEFAPFNELRKKMDTDRLGYFELFDPAIHLTGAERSELEHPGRLLRAEQLTVLPDKTLAIKNSRVLVYVPDENYYRNRREYPTYHLAQCEEFETFRRELGEQELLATTRMALDYELVKLRPGGEVSVVSHGFVVCKSCLHTLRYRDFDAYRNRKRGYSQRVLSEFRLEDFFRLYRQYPLSFMARRET